MCGGISTMGMLMITAGLATIYAITTFGPKLCLQNKVRAMKAKMAYRTYRFPFSI
jgi:hypothetical protein